METTKNKICYISRFMYLECTRAFYTATIFVHFNDLYILIIYMLVYFVLGSRRRVKYCINFFIVIKYMSDKTYLSTNFSFCFNCQMKRKYDYTEYIVY